MYMRFLFWMFVAGWCGFPPIFEISCNATIPVENQASSSELQSIAGKTEAQQGMAKVTTPTSEKENEVHQTNSTSIAVPNPSRISKKEAVLASSIIVSAYEHGRFVGIVLIDRGRDPLGQALPGGMVRWGETCEECAKRTLVDECGITSVSNLQQFHVYSNPQRDPRVQVIDAGFRARIDDITLGCGTDARRAWICPIDKIPWDKLVFDHSTILKDFIEYSLTRPILFSERISTPGDLTKRNADNYNRASERAYRLSLLTSWVIVEIYEAGNFKGIILLAKGKDNAERILPECHVESGETIENAAHRAVYEKCHLPKVKDIRQFKIYFDDEDPANPHNVFVQLARVDTDKAINPELYLYDIYKIPTHQLPKLQARVLQDYFDYRQGKVEMLLIDSKLSRMQGF